MTHTNYGIRQDDASADHSFGRASIALCAAPFSSKYAFTASLAVSTTDASSTVDGTLTVLSTSPCTPFSSNSLNTRRSVFPDRVLGMMGLALDFVRIMPPSEAMAPTWVRTSFWTSARSWVSSSWHEGEVSTKAKGKAPLRASGMGTTQASDTFGWDVIACSSVPVDSLWAATLMISSEKKAYQH